MFKKQRLLTLSIPPGLGSGRWGGDTQAERPRECSRPPPRAPPRAQGRARLPPLVRVPAPPPRRPAPGPGPREGGPHSVGTELGSVFTTTLHFPSSRVSNCILLQVSLQGAFSFQESALSLGIHSRPASVQHPDLPKGRCLSKEPIAKFTEIDSPAGGQCHGGSLCVAAVGTGPSGSEAGSPTRRKWDPNRYTGAFSSLPAAGVCEGAACGLPGQQLSLGAWRWTFWCY